MHKRCDGWAGAVSATHATHRKHVGKGTADTEKGWQWAAHPNNNLQAQRNSKPATRPLRGAGRRVCVHGRVKTAVRVASSELVSGPVTLRPYHGAWHLASWGIPCCRL